MIHNFSFHQPARIVFGVGRFSGLADFIGEFGDEVLVLTGKGSLKASGKLDRLLSDLKQRSIKSHFRSIAGEPSPERVDEIAATYRARAINVVVGIGGGSVLDAAKAVSAMFPVGGSALEYLEGVGTGAEHPGVKAPFIAVPTTAGTGTEATNNAVLSSIGPDGFKKSLRHESFVPDIALVDPELTAGCPPSLTAACGLDALTQLLESYVSPKASPMTDFLAESGLEHLARSLIPVCTSSPDDISLRADLSYAATISGITLANAGLGVVHGLASPIGAHFEIPHGVVCGNLLGPATRMNINRLRGQSDSSNTVLEKYAWVGSLLSGRPDGTLQAHCDQLVKTLEEWTEKLNVPRFSDYGIAEKHLDQIVGESSNKNNPVLLDAGDMKKICQARIVGSAVRTI